jgi:hypothetical protein
VKKYLPGGRGLDLGDQGGRSTTDDDGDVGGGGDHLCMRERNRREKERKDRGGRSRRLFKFSTSRTNRTGVSRAVCCGVTDGHMSKGGWADSHTVYYGATKLCQTTRRDSCLCGATSSIEHVSPRLVMLMHMVRLLHKS